MKANEIVVGELYIAKVSGKLCRVRIDGQAHGMNGRLQYFATNMDSGKQIRIRSPQRLRRRVSAPIPQRIEESAEKLSVDSGLPKESAGMVMSALFGMIPTR